MQTSVHKIDSSRIEIRTIHEIAPGKSVARKRSFELSAYFFVPHKLAHGSGDEADSTLAQPVVFPKLQRKNYYEIFAMSLPTILEPSSERSPLARLEGMAQEISLPIESVLYELQMLVCVTKNACNNARRAQIQRIRARSGSLSSDSVERIREELHREVEAEFTRISHSYLQIQNRLEQLGERYLHEVLQHVAQAYRWTLEDLNHQIIDWMLRALRLGKHYHFSAEFLQFLQAELELQWQYQKQHGFATLSDDEYNNENYLFHQRELKAWRYGGLSMASAGARRQGVMGQVWLSVASAVAMMFALGVTLLTMYYYGQWSMPFVFFAIFGYMFKDRIKELLRKLLADKFGSFQLLNLYDPRSKVHCGNIREGLEICEALPEKVHTLRQLRKNPLSQYYNREVVIAYRERLSIDSQKLFKTHRRLQKGCQVLEFNLSPYLQNIKESEAKKLWHPLQPEQRQAESPKEGEQSFLKAYQKLRVQRSYHVTLVLETSSEGRAVSERHRIVLRDGRIAWIEQVV